MKVGLEKPRTKLSTTITTISSTTIIVLAIAFMIINWENLITNNLLFVNNSPIAVLEPTSSDSVSERNNDGDDDGTNNNPDDHGLPCLDPNCPIHHPHDDDNGDNDGDGFPDNNDGNDNRIAPPADISMDVIKFKPNMAEYVDNDIAISVLTSYLDSFDRYFEKYPDGKIYLVGGVARTAGWTLSDPVDIELSQQRADAVRNSLITLGVNADRLVSIGIGSNDPWRSDEWSEGYFDEEIAKINRRVWIVPDAYNSQMQLIFDIQESIE